MKFIIEHLDKRLYKWCFLEYKHISKIVGRDKVIFTNISGAKSKQKLSEYGVVHDKSIVNLNEIAEKRICVLEPFAEKTLNTEDKLKFDYFIFGGILGDYPPQKRTAGFCDRLRNAKINTLRKVETNTSRKTEIDALNKDETKIKFETRNLGKEQMSTDTAVYAAKKILDGKDIKKLSDLKFKDTIIIKINENEEVELPFRYVVEKDKQGKEEVILPDGFVEFLKKRKGF